MLAELLVADARWGDQLVEDRDLRMVVRVEHDLHLAGMDLLRNLRVGLGAVVDLTGGAEPLGLAFVTRQITGKEARRIGMRMRGARFTA